jgi:mRNA-degrading endonuclease RelE of RelBE toxin-antitoxin system
MVKPGRQFRLWVEPDVNSARESLPGKIRQRMKRLINGLSVEPRPTNSRILDTAELDVPVNVEVRRLRLDRWRILYALNDADGWVWILQIHKRPPYQYEDLPELVSKLS